MSLCLQPKLTDRRDGDEDVVSRHRVVIGMSVRKELFGIVVEIRGRFERTACISVKQAAQIIPSWLVGRLG